MPSYHHSSFLARYSLSSQRPMARRIRQRKQWSFSSFFSFMRMFLFFILSRWILFLGFSIVVFLVWIAFFSSLFTLRDYFIVLDDRSGCLSRDYVREYFSLHVRSIWDIFLFSDADLLATHSCARKFVLIWSPFHYRFLQVRVVAYTPVFKVRFERIAHADTFSDTLRFFQLPIIGDEYRYLLSNGHFVALDSEPVIPEIVFRVSSLEQSIDAFRFPRSHVYSLLQLYGYFQEHFGDSFHFVVSDSGIVHVRTDSVAHIYLSLRSSLVEQLRSLRAFYDATTINTSKLESVDVRFGYVVARDRQ